MYEYAFQGRLLPGERIAWSGRAGDGLVFTAADIFIIPFSIVWCTFAFTMVFTTSAAHAPAEFPMIGSLFAAVGFYMVAGRFIIDWLVRRGLRYAVTDRRILIARAAPFRRFTAIGLAQLADVNLIERTSGRGTIRFGPEQGLRHNGFGSLSPALDPTPQFIAIDDVRRVFDLVQRASADAASRASG